MPERPLPTLLAVHAHPDDETITMGGTLARYAAEGARVVVVTCTSGDVGEISAAGLATASTLGDVRRRELADALHILGVARSVVLPYRDSGMAGWPENHASGSLWSADLDEVVGRVVEVIRAERPQVLLTYDERGGYGHPDHVRARQVAEAGFHAAGDPGRFPDAGPAWTVSKLYEQVFPKSYVDRFTRALRDAGIDAPPTAPSGADGVRAEDVAAYGTPDDLVTTTIDTSAFAETKHDALAAHRTQMGPDQFLMRMPPEVVRAVWSREFYRRLHPPPDGAPEADLFAGLR